MKSVCMLVAFVVCKNCIQRSNCSCEFDDGSGLVDLSSLGNKNHTPRFKDVLQTDEGNYYSYNPCGGFTEGSGCFDAAVCVLHKDKSQQKSICNSHYVKFAYNKFNGNITVAYTLGTGELVITLVDWLCEKMRLIQCSCPMEKKVLGFIKCRLQRSARVQEWATRIRKLFKVTQKKMANFDTLKKTDEHI